MNSCLFLLALVFYLSSSVSSLVLENLCQNSTFDYKGKFKINSVYRYTMNKTLPRVGSYAFDEDEDYTPLFKDAKDLQAMETLREKYNQLIVEGIYNEETLNNQNQLGNMEQNLNTLENFRSQTAQLREKADQQYL